MADHQPTASPEEQLGWVREAMAGQNSVGITGIHNMDGGRETLEALAALEAADQLNLRVRQHSWIDPSDDEDTLRDVLARRDLRGRLWTANSVKLMIDGVIDTGTAWLEEPDAHGDGGAPMWPDPTRYREVVRRFHNAGFFIATHAIGDRAVREVLDAYAAVGSAGRHRIEHIEAAPPALQSRFRAEAVSASMQPV